MPSEPPNHPRGANETILVVTAVISLVVTVIVALFGDGLLTSGRGPSTSGRSWVVEHLWLSFVILFALIMLVSGIIAMSHESDVASGIAALAGAALVGTLVLWSMVELSFWWTTLAVLAVVTVIGLAMPSKPTAAVGGGVLGVLLVGWLVVTVPFWVTLLIAVGLVVLFFVIGSLA